MLGPLFQRAMSALSDVMPGKANVPAAAKIMGVTGSGHVESPERPFKPCRSCDIFFQLLAGGLLQMRSVIIAWAILSALFVTTPASADKRVALVIGNGDYAQVGLLTNPTNDAQAIARMLEEAGFDSVDLHKNLDFRKLRQVIAEFSANARTADVAVVYYSGHGIELDGVNYLVPVDAVLANDVDVRYEAFALDDLVRALEPPKRLRLIMLDACRDNPFVRRIKRTVSTTRGFQPGLAPPSEASANMLIAFAAKAGSYAYDGEGTNSPYAAALLKHLPTPGLDVRIAFGRVRDEVLGQKNRQEPVFFGSLGGESISIVGTAAPGAVAIAPLPQPPVQPPPTLTPGTTNDRAAQAWAEIKNSSNVALLRAFISRFGDTFYGDVARARLEELKKEQAAAEAKREAEQAAEREAEAKRAAEREAEKRAESERIKKELEAESQRKAEEAEKRRAEVEEANRRVAVLEVEAKQAAEREAEAKRAAEEAKREAEQAAEREAEAKRLAEREAEAKRAAERDAEYQRQAAARAEEARREEERKRLAALPPAQSSNSTSATATPSLTPGSGCLRIVGEWIWPFGEHSIFYSNGAIGKVTTSGVKNFWTFVGGTWSCSGNNYVFKRQNWIGRYTVSEDGRTLTGNDNFTPFNPTYSLRRK